MPVPQLGAEMARMAFSADLQQGGSGSAMPDGGGEDGAAQREELAEERRAHRCDLFLTFLSLFPSFLSHLSHFPPHLSHASLVVSFSATGLKLEQKERELEHALGLRRYSFFNSLTVCTFGAGSPCIFGIKRG